MRSYKLTYFHNKARAEVARLLFAIAGVEYEDIRLDAEQWQEYKSKAPFGQIPILEVDGKQLCQSRAIDFFLAKTFGLAGDSDFDQARAAMISDCLEDLRAHYRLIYWEKDENRKVELRNVFESSTYKPSLDNFEKLLAENGDGWFIGNKMTYADVAFYHHSSMLTVMSGVKVDWDKWPKLKSVRDKVEAHPKVAEWIAKRPITPL